MHKGQLPFKGQLALLHILQVIMQGGDSLILGGENKASIIKHWRFTLKVHIDSKLKPRDHLVNEQLR